MIISDSSYNKLADQVYNVEPSKAKTKNEYPVVENDIITDPKTGVQYKVLQVQDTNDNANIAKANGMQAMAVAPEINGEADTTQIVIAYAGTNSSDLKDIQTDVQMIFGGNTDDLIIDTGVREYDYVLADAQSKTALEFAEKIRKKYRHATITTTGHSLGESLA